MPVLTPGTSAGFYVGRIVAPPVSVSISNETAVGATTIGFSASTKVVKVGEQITIRFQTSPQLAGARIGIWVARKVGGTWTQFQPHASITLDSNGVGYYVYSAGSRVWQSFAGVFNGNATYAAARSFARQARWIQ